MKLRNKIWLFLGLFAFIGAVVITVLLYLPTDIEVSVCGHVIDAHTYNPIDSAQVLITNERYENDRGYTNYDEFLGKDTVTVITDSTGYFHATFKKSAYVYLEIHKNGYEIFKVQGKYARRIMNYDIELQNIKNSSGRKN